MTMKIIIRPKENATRNTNNYQMSNIREFAFIYVGLLALWTVAALLNLYLAVLAFLVREF